MFIITEPTPPHKHGSEAPSITIPKTPNLETRSRYRPVMVMSQAQIDEQEIEELKKYVPYREGTIRYVLYEVKKYVS